MSNGVMQMNNDWITDDIRCLESKITAHVSEVIDLKS